MSKIFRAIGLMSGTSLDGIDLAMIESDGGEYIKLIASDYLEYTNEFRQNLRDLIFQNPTLEGIKKIENEITILHANLVNNFLKKNNLKASEIDLIGFHGQTIFHQPAKKITWQIGNSQLLALMTGIKTVSDFRVRDVLEGGQGAPLVPIYHFYLFAKLAKPNLILNIGGVANLSYFDDKIDSLQAFDTCFGNAPSNDLMHKKFQKEFDENGDLAKSGKINLELINKILAHEIFNQTLPKSFSRNDFDEALAPLQSLDPQDILACYSQIFAEVLAKDIYLFSQKPKQIIVCGGGAKNKNLLEVLQKKLIDIKILTAQEIGFNVDSIEAEAFAFLAIRRVLNLPISFKKTTGTLNLEGSIGGIIYEN
jgi:anhydro-N-acetylmuramic acid kinase